MKRLIILREGVYLDAQNRPRRLGPGDLLETGPGYGASLVRDGFAEVEKDAPITEPVAEGAEFATSADALVPESRPKRTRSRKK